MGATVSHSRSVGDTAGLGLTRRQFMRLSIITGISVAVLSSCTTEALSAFAEKIRNRPIRRNIATMSASDPYIAQYAQVVRTMRDRSAANPADPTGWEGFVVLHRRWCPHGNWLWLPWHRELLFRFERIAQNILEDPSFGVPYWNWTEQRSIPPAFRSGDLLVPGRARSMVTDSDELSGQAGGAAEIDTAMGLRNFEEFASFRIPFPAGVPTAADQQTHAGTQGRLEQPTHNSVHTNVGGLMGSTSSSPNDPIFYTHHAMLDYLWTQWNEAGNPNTADDDWNRWSFKANPFPNPDGSMVASSVVTSAWTMLYPALSYQYEPSTVGTG